VIPVDLKLTIEFYFDPEITKHTNGIGSRPLWPSDIVHNVKEGEITPRIFPLQGLWSYLTMF
jgi:hypothetical protein